MSCPIILKRVQWNSPGVIVSSGDFNDSALSLLGVCMALFSLILPGQHVQRHTEEENQYCVVLSSTVLFYFPQSPGQGINTMKTQESSGNDLLPKGLSSASIYPFCFRFDGDFTLLWEADSFKKWWFEF